MGVDAQRGIPTVRAKCGSSFKHSGLKGKLHWQGLECVKVFAQSE